MFTVRNVYRAGVVFAVAYLMLFHLEDKLIAFELHFDLRQHSIQKHNQLIHQNYVYGKTCLDESQC